MKKLIMATVGELALKGLNKRTFERALMKTIRKRLAQYGDWKITSSQSAIYIEPINENAEINTQKAFQKCLHIFGIAAASLSTICEKDLEIIQQTAETTLNKELSEAKTFKVVARRADKTFPLNSLEISREVGGYLLGKFPNLKVDVKTPELTVGVEIRELGAYVHGGKQKGVCGMPVPTSGRAVLLLSGGIDSPVAAWMMGKRGLGLVAVHFASPPYTSPRAAAKVEALANQLTEYMGPLPYYLVEYTKTQEYLRDNLPRQEYFTVIMRRSMLRIAKQIAIKEQCEAIITGESLAQVASQTLQAIACTDEAQSLPILRPCIGMDKTEITEIARKIGTFETSIQPFEDCCTIFTPPHPKTKPKINEVLAYELAMPQLLELEDEAAANVVFKLVGGG